MKAEIEEHLDEAISGFLRRTKSTLRSSMTVYGALQELRERGIDEGIIYFYVLDDDGKLVGVMPTRSLILSPPEARIENVMKRGVVTVQSDRPLWEAMSMFAVHRYLALPVVDRDGKFEGVIDVKLYSDEAEDMAAAEHEADVFQIIGVWIEQYRGGGPIKAFRIRMPWLVCNLVGGLISAVIATAFGAVLEQAIVIAAFIPLVLTLCESVAIQSLTLAIQFMHASKVNFRQIRRLAWGETTVSVLLGLTCATLVGIAALMWAGFVGAVLVISVSILIAMCVAAVLGLLVPLVLHMAKLDPRVAAGPLVLMLVDITAMLVYLGLAHVILMRP
ncbi:MAG: magnesium transporter [Phycisphaerales bacterium]